MSVIVKCIITSVGLCFFVSITVKVLDKFSSSEIVKTWTSKATKICICHFMHLSRNRL